MEKEKHVAGPWDAMDLTYIDAIRDDGTDDGANFNICEVTWGPQVSDDEKKATLRMMAAAPKMLKALQAVEDMAHDNGGFHKGYSHIAADCRACQVKAAIYEALPLPEAQIVVDIRREKGGTGPWVADTCLDHGPETSGGYAAKWRCAENNGMDHGRGFSYPAAHGLSVGVRGKEHAGQRRGRTMGSDQGIAPCTSGIFLRSGLHAA